MEAPSRRLFSQCSYPSVFASWDWASHWWRHFGVQEARGGPIVVAAYDRQERIIGLAAFYEAPARLRWLGERRLEPFGVLRPVDLLSEEPVFLSRTGHESAAMEAICRHLRERPPRLRWNHFTLNVLRPLCDPLGNDGCAFGGRPRAVDDLWLQTVCDCGAYLSALTDSWDEYRRRLSRSMRDNLAYYPRKLTKAGHRWSVRLVRRPDQIRAWLPVLFSQHADRAHSGRGRRHVDHIPDEKHRRFLLECLPALAASGMAFLAVLEVDGRPVASQTFLEAGGILTFCNSGFDPDWYDFSPLTIVAAEVIRDAIGRRVSTLNFLPWDAPWKTRWGARQGMLREHRVGFSRHPVAWGYAASRRFHLRRTG